MEKIKKRIANLKVAGKLKVYRMTVLVMTLFLVLVALISTLVIRLNIEKITEVWSPSLEYLQDLETMTAKYRIKQYQHLVESDAAIMNSCEEEIQKLESQIQDTCANLDAIMSADSDARKGQDHYEVAKAAWEEYRAASDEILKLSRAGKQQEASKLMTGKVYEEYKALAEKLTILSDEFQAELDRAKTMANVCTIIIFIVIVAAGLAIAVVTTQIGKIITNSITEPVEQIDAAVASLRKGELSNVEMLTYESEDEFGDTIRNLKEAMGILADYVSEISVEVKAIAQGDLTRNGNDITDFLGDFSELKALQRRHVLLHHHVNRVLSGVNNFLSNHTHERIHQRELFRGIRDRQRVFPVVVRCRSDSNALHLHRYPGKRLFFLVRNLSRYNDLLYFLILLSIPRSYDNHIPVKNVRQI